jgi:hypothetical protein
MANVLWKLLDMGQLITGQKQNALGDHDPWTDGASERWMDLHDLSTLSSEQIPFLIELKNGGDEVCHSKRL